MLKIAFDVDGTLITTSQNGISVPNYDVIEIYRWFQSRGCKMFVWSGGGFDYARTWADKLGLNPDMILRKEKGDIDIDIAFDDEYGVDLAKINVCTAKKNF